MDPIEVEVRNKFGFSMQSKLCKKCLQKHTEKYEIDQLLHMNAKAQSNLGTDSTVEEKYKALDIAKYVKASILSIDEAKAESLFPEINLL
tara:strand:- start:753 stop:1022 length:270 start_codon:yes stop_codon:yes gene_type:complete